MLLSELDYHLPDQLIAQRPLAERDASRLLVLGRETGAFADRRFVELPDLLSGRELLVFNNTRVIPARLFGYRVGAAGAQAPGKASAGEFLTARIEVLLVRRLEPCVWEALVRPGRKVRVGERIRFERSELEAEIVSRGEFGLRQLRFDGGPNAEQAIEQIGHVPLPPYIRRADEPADRERYQTVFASQPGAVAAPTAGLHFTPAVLERLRDRGVQSCEITLEVGLGTFQPVHGDDLDAHRIHSERYQISEQSAAALREARREGRPVLAVGTTVVRALEDAAQKNAASGGPPGEVAVGPADAEIFIRPGHRFAIVDQMLTNFHLPRSTLLALVAGFAGKDRILKAYRHAVESGYRFYSYGDCMLIR